MQVFMTTRGISVFVRCPLCFPPAQFEIFQAYTDSDTLAQIHWFYCIHIYRKACTLSLANRVTMSQFGKSGLAKIISIACVLLQIVTHFPPRLFYTSILSCTLFNNMLMSFWEFCAVCGKVKLDCYRHTYSLVSHVQMFSTFQTLINVHATRTL